MTTELRTRQIADANITLAKLASDVRLDTITAPTGSVGFNSQKITSLLDPTSAQDGATKNYVDTSIATAVTGLFEYKGVIDCSTNPNYPAAVVGDAYKVSVAGKIGGASGLVVEVGDTIYCNTNSAGGTQAAVGADFDVLQVNIDINALAGAGLVVNGAALDVNVDNSSIEITADALNVKASGITNAMLAGSIADSKLSTISTANKVSGSAVQLTATGGLEDSTGLKIKPDVTTGATVLPIAIAANGAGVTLDNSTLENNAGTGRVKTGGITATQLASDAVTTVKILNANVTLAKIAPAAANSKLLGSGAAGVGADYVELTLGTGLSMSGTTLNSTETTLYADNEVPSGTINGANVTFVLANAPIAGSVHLYLNGAKITVANGDFTISGATITMVTAPLTGETLNADYRY